jgi:hypothetical protein
MSTCLRYAYRKGEGLPYLRAVPVRRHQNRKPKKIYNKKGISEMSYGGFSPVSLV